MLIDKLEALLAAATETAVLRFSLGNAYLANNVPRAIIHFTRATELDPNYSAAWKMLGKALASAARDDDAAAAFVRGIEVATQQGDVQAAKEMQVFLKRLKR